MKITKITVGVFFLAFVIGCISVVYYVSFFRKQESIQIQKTTVIIPEKIIIRTENEPSDEDILEWETQYQEIPKYKIKLLKTGEFHGDEVTARTGETWLGLFKEKNKYLLRSTKIKVTKVHDQIVDYEMKRKTGKQVSVNSKSEPIFILKNAASLREGEVFTAFHGIEYQDFNEAKSLEEGFAQEYEISGKKYWLKVEELLNQKQQKILALILSSENEKQILFSMRKDFTTSLGDLYWVGDLDRDGKPDIFTSLYIHDNVEYRNLFLSSKAKNNNLIEKVAVLWQVGC